MSKKTWYGITCSDGTNKVSDSVTVVVREGAGTELSLKLNAYPLQVKKGESATLTWSSTGAGWCWSAGSWSGGRPLNGTFATGPMWKSKYYKLTCHKGTESALASVTVNVADIPVIRWNPPTENEDGSTLTDLAGYDVYWGKQSRTYYGTARISSASWTQFQPKSLAPGTYYMAVTARDAQGNESGYSNEIQVVIP
jgi:hypothetical protein